MTNKPHGRGYLKKERSGLDAVTGHKSLAELMSEHESKSSALYTLDPSLSSLFPLSAGVSDLSRTPSSLLSCSLSSLTLRDDGGAREPRETPSAAQNGLSLADLINQHQNCGPGLYAPIPGLPNAAAIDPPGIPSLSDLMLNCAVPQGAASRTLDVQDSPDPSTRPRRLHGDSIKRDGIFGRPSVFALTICTRPRTIRTRRAGSLHKAFLYSRQMVRVREPVKVPHHHITPFSFHTLSPDDIVRAKQKQAFSRD